MRCMGGVFQFFLSSLFGFLFIYLVSFIYLFFIWFLSRLCVVARISYYIDSQRNQTGNHMCLD